MTRSDLELKVGVFVFIGLLIFIIFIFSIGKFYIFNPGYYLKAIFKYSDGIAVSAPVRLAGFEVGEVKDVGIFYDTQAQCTKIQVILWVKKDVKIEKDAQVSVNSLGFMGEKYIEVTPGTIGSELVKNNDTLVGSDSIPIRKLADEGYRIMSASRKMLDSMNEILGTDENREQLKELAPDLVTLVKRANSILTKIDNGEGTIGKFITDETVYKNFEAFSDDIRKHPWKLLFKPKGTKETTSKEK